MEIVDAAGRRMPDGWSVNALSGLETGALRIRQRPGPRNALGPIKFVFPNNDGVYLHGTPEQALFLKTRRDFSHGCVRVADPVALAAWVLQDLRGWTPDRIEATTRGTQTQSIKVEPPVQVLFFYTTAMWEDGTLRFADDIYSRDSALAAALDTVTAARSGSRR